MAEPTKIETIHPLEAFVKRWRQLLVLRHGLLALGGALVLVFTLFWWLSLSLLLVLGVMVWLGLWLLLAWREPYGAINLQTAAAWFDRQHPQLEHSTELVLQDPDQLSLPARLQRKRVQETLNPIFITQKPPVEVLKPLGMAAALLLLGSFLVQLWSPPQEELDSIFSSTTEETTAAAREQARAVRRELPQLKDARVRLAPPTYTSLPARFYDLSDLETPAGSRVTWQLRFTDNVRRVYLVNQKNDTLRFSRTQKGAWVGQLQADAPLFYRIGYATATDTSFSSFLKITVQPDEAPRLRILQPQQYLLEQQGAPFVVEVEAQDDYGLEDVYLNLTISRGSGENVSFRDEKIWIDLPKGAREAKQRLQLKPRALGMQPGDELYYRLEAHDNRPPRGQHWRSNSWFYQWQDTAATSSMLSSGLALDVEPEYFRSQRQIIIDTEKLIRTQKSTPVATWEKANQDLGVEQKLLRLRYGKFLGEEFESAAGGGPGHDHAAEAKEEHDEHEEHDDETEYDNDRHQHDLAGHEEPAGAAPATGLLEMFGHAHDTEEGATFYEESIKVKLKAALAEMWEAEKYLRLSQPRQALPYEYRALKIIKDVQQSTRIYVERVGLDLPTLIPQEHRLKGKQEKILPQSRSQRTAVSDTLAASRQLLGRLSFWEAAERLDGKDQQLVRQAGREVARLLVLGGPFMQHFYLLNSLNHLQEAEVPAAAEVRKVQRGLLALLPDQHRPAASPQQLSPYQKQFLQSPTSTARD